MLKTCVIDRNLHIVIAFTVCNDKLKSFFYVSDANQLSLHLAARWSCQRHLGLSYDILFKLLTSLLKDKYLT